MKNVLVVSPDPVFYGPVLEAFVGTDNLAEWVGSSVAAIERMRDQTKGRVDAIVTAGRSHGVEYADEIVPVAKELGIKPIIVLTKYRDEYEMQHEKDPDIHVVSNCNANYCQAILRILEGGETIPRSQVPPHPQNLE